MKRVLRIMTTPRREPSAGRDRRDLSDRGQAALAMVLAIGLMLVTAGGAIAVNAMAHDPLVQTDAAEHYAFRALEAGINSYLTTINARPDLVDCSSASQSNTCTNTTGGAHYDAWTQVPQTTSATGNVAEYYLWTNPQLCFSQSRTTETKCTASPTNSRGNFEYLKVKVIGAAGYPGHYVYQSSVVDFAPAQGFLTHVWWSNYESTYTRTLPHTETPAHYCKYNWQTYTKTTTYKGTPRKKYMGADGSCGTIVFASRTVVDGPVFSNDSIYVYDTGYGKPKFGTPTTRNVNSPVETADPKCLFVLDQFSDTRSCATVAKNDVTRYTKANSHYGLAQESVPTSDSTLITVAKLNGCTYVGPTTISLYAIDTTQYMNVTSPETRVSKTPATTGHDEENDPSNRHICTGPHVEAPTGANGGNGVIYVANSTVGTGGTPTLTCTGNGDNPFDGTVQHKRDATVKTWATWRHPSTVKAQILAGGTFPGTSTGYVFPDGETARTDDCAGDAFVRDADSATKGLGGTPGIAGNLTIAAQDNIVITGNLEYTNCGSTFENADHYAKTCKYTPAVVNDSLGLIATDYIEVNRPGIPSCKHPKSNAWPYPTLTTETTCSSSSPTSVFGQCSTTVSDLTAVLCSPGGNLVIDAAVLALKHSFAVNDYTAKATTPTLRTKTLDMYGSIDQDWRGAVGKGLNGYKKHYVWDSRLQYVSIPHYLTPDTPSWNLASSSVQLSTSCPTWPKPYPKGSTTTTANYPAATTKGPTGASGAC